MNRLLRITVWFGLVAGLIEGVALLTFQQLGWLAGIRFNVPVSSEIIWISPLVDVLLFGTVGVALIVVGRLFPRVPVTRYAVLLGLFLLFYDWLALTGYLYRYAVATLALGLAITASRPIMRREAACLHAVDATLPILAGLALCAAVGIQGGHRLQERILTAQLPAAAPGAANVLVIVVDTLRADHLSLYGYARPTSPHLDEVARHGVVFDNAVSTSSWTLPAHASMVTGRYTYEHGAEQRPLDQRYPTIAEALRGRGYRTAAFSGNVMFFNRAQGFGRGFLHFEDYFQTLGDCLMRTIYGREARKPLLRIFGIEDIIGRRRAADINPAVRSWIERDPSRPFFVFINYFDTHDPYVPPQPYRAKFSTTPSPGGLLRFPQAGDVFTRYPDLTPEQLQEEIDAYDGAIAYTDEHLHELLNDLRRGGWLDHTFVIITADHGESFGDHGLVLHRNALYRELIRVPLIISYPGMVPAGRRIDQPVSLAALPATIMAFAGAPNPAPFPQQSLSQAWKTEDNGTRWPLPIAELAHTPWGPKDPPVYKGSMQTVVTPDWHYIHHDTLGIQLYRWKDDPGELHDVAQDPAFQDVVTQLQAQLAARPHREALPGANDSPPPTATAPPACGAACANAADVVQP